MKKIREIWGLYLLVPFFIIAVTGGFLYKKGEVELMLNHFHNSFADQFFRYYTYLGDGWIFVLLLLILLYYRYYYLVMTLVVIIFQTAVVQVMKMILFSDWNRPVLFFSHTPGVHFVEGVTMHLYQTFPSGHAATAFSVATILTIVVKNKRWSALWYGLAIGVCFSRVYLMQHFFMDVFTGAAIGIAVTLLSWGLLEMVGLGRNESLNRSLNH